MAKDRFDPNSQDCNSRPGGTENFVKAGYGPVGGSKRQNMRPSAPRTPSSAPRNAKRVRG